jgi:hypothetical protein
MSTQRAYVSGNVRGFLYEFKKVGDQIPAHTHENAAAKGGHHNVIVLRGAVCVVLPYHTITVRVGDDPLDFDGLLEHTIVALMPGTKILNLYRDRVPDDFDPNYSGTF